MSDDGLSEGLCRLRNNPSLATERLRLEPLRAGHAKELAPILSDWRLYEFIGGRPLGLEELRGRFARQAVGWSVDGRERWLNWVVRKHASGSAVGQIQATVTTIAPERGQLAWTIAVGAQGRGYAREAAAAVAAWLGRQGVRELTAYIHPDHVASRRVAASLGLSPTEEMVQGEVRWSTKAVGARDVRIRVGGAADEPYC